MDDTVTAIEEAIKCVEAALRALDGAKLTGVLSVKKNGIATVLRHDVLRRLRDIHERVEDET